MSATSKGGRKAKPVAPELAMAMLSSALAYCQQAGLTVRLTNDGGDCLARIVGVQAATGADGINRFSLANPTTIMAIVTATPDPSPSEAA